jgi:hypothetical protein
VLAVEFSRGIEDAWADIATFVPKFIGFLIVLVLGYLLVKAIAKIAAAALEKVGFDKAVERGGVKKALEKSKYDASDIVGKIIFYALFLMVLQLAFGVFGANPASDLIEGVIAYLPKVFAAILIIVVATAIAAAARELLDATLGSLSYGKAVANAASAFIIGFGFFAALNQLQIATDIVNGLFYAILAVIAGSAIIAIGGGGIAPMRAQWEKALSKMEEEAPRIREQRQGAKDRIQQRVQDRTEQAQQVDGKTASTGSSRLGS